MSKRSSITPDEKKTDQEVASGERRTAITPAWRTSVARATEFLTIVDDDGCLVYVTRPQGRIEDYEGKSVYDFVPSEYREELRRCFVDSRTTKLPQWFECQAAGPDGETSFYSSWVFPVDGFGAGCTGFLSIDITDQRRLQTALERSETLLRTMIEQAPDYILIADRQHRIEFVNRPPLPGLTVDALLGQPLDAFLPEDEREAASAAVERVFTTGEPGIHETTVQGPQGRMHVTTRIGPIRQSGSVQRVMLISSDSTGRRAAEQLTEQLRQSQKLEAIGQLTGGIAHDFNNLLTAIGGHLELIEEDGDATEGIRELAEGAREAVERAAELTSRLLVFSRKQALQPKTVQLNDQVLNLVALLRRTLGERIQIRTDLAHDLASCEVDPSQLETALLNLCVNSRDAMPVGGILTLRTRNLPAADLQPAEVAVEVADVGSGMTAEVVERACEPFFTTKDVGRGSGLGLSMVYGFVQQSGGRLEIQSEPGQGTCVQIRLPALALPPVPAKEKARLTSAVFGQGRRVLLVEDELQVAGVIERRLARWGFHIEHVTTAQAALELLEKAPPFDLLFSDLGLPGGMNGCELAHRALQRQRTLCVLLTSGYSPDQIGSLGALPKGVEVLSKPYSGAALIQGLERALNAPA